MQVPEPQGFGSHGSAEVDNKERERETVLFACLFLYNSGAALLHYRRRITLQDYGKCQNHKPSTASGSSKTAGVDSDTDGAVVGLSVAASGVTA